METAFHTLKNPLYGIGALECSYRVISNKHFDKSYRLICPARTLHVAPL
jgi:hypothetical protein